jgi:hypothetical protein
MTRPPRRARASSSSGAVVCPADGREASYLSGSANIMSTAITDAPASRSRAIN